jgi:ADP-ribose pyrophosphatase
MAEKDYEIIEQTPLYRGFFNLSRVRLRHTKFAGGWSEVLDRELFHRGRCVAVLPYDPDADRVVLIEQFRVGALGVKNDPWLLEVVAGAVEDGESPEDVAHREGFEEAGCRIRELIPIGEFFPTPGACSERVTLFCGLVDSAGVGGVHGLAEEHEDIRVSAVDSATALAWLEEGVIDTGVAIIALQWLALNRERLRSGAP